MSKVITLMDHFHGFRIEFYEINITHLIINA